MEGWPGGHSSLQGMDSKKKEGVKIGSGAPLKRRVKSIFDQYEDLKREL